MKILVCVKRTPDTAAKVAIAADGVSINESGVEFVLNPYDEFAVEAAVRLKESQGAEVTLVCLGPPEATKEIRWGLAMGADKALHLKDAAASRRDAFSVAQALAATIRGLEYDLILCGKQAVDDDNHQVPSVLAALLDLPVANVCTALEVADGTARVQRAIEGGSETLALPLPAIVSCTKGLAEPRYPSLPNIMKAKKKEITELEAPAVPNRVVVEKLELPPPRPAGRIVGEGPDAAAELVRLLRSEAKIL